MEVIMLKIILGATILAVTLLLNPVTSEAKKEYLIEGPVYLKVNIHYQCNSRDCKASYANYTDPGEGHGILSVNTPVKIEKWRRKGFIIVDTENNKEIYFEYNEPRMQMSQEEYLNKITSPVKVSLDNLSDADKKGIKEGRLVVGMSKTGVMMLYGYPATHRTPSLDSNRWIYWTNRFTTFEVNFNDKGLVQ
jgi:hypothetical protein